jgi:bifunctional polynucleotide phosphatase/kinase
VLYKYKPNPLSFTSLVGYDEKTIDKDASFFVGDALGRKGDFADTDKLFAEVIGIRWISPESMFGGEPASFKVDIAFSLSEDPEIIIMVGYPGSGKSTIARKICEDNSKYIHIESDVLKTSAKMIKNAAAHIADKKSIIFDATNSSVKKRKEYIEFAKKHGYNVTCVHVETSKEESYKRNKTREEAKQVPKSAYSVYSKHFEQPKEEEGFRLYEA